MRLYSETHGSGDQTIIVCNGLTQTTANWRGLARANSHLRWVLYDARGHGKSPAVDEPYVIDHHVDDLMYIMDQYQLDKPVLMGFSHGARIALRAAAEKAEHFAGLILVSCGAQSTPRRRAHVASWSNCLELGGLHAMVWASLPNIVGRKILEKYPDLDMLVKGSVSRNNEDSLKRMFAGMKTYPEPHVDATRVQMPALVIRGHEDPLLTADDGTLFIEWMKNAHEVVFQECGHTVPLEEPKAFMQSIEQFIKERV